MKKIISIFLSCVISACSSGPAFAQLKIEALKANAANVPLFEPQIQRDNIVPPVARLDVLKNKQEALHAKLSIDTLMADIEESVKKNQPNIYVEKVNRFNALLLSYLEDRNIDVRIEGAGALIKQMEQGSILASDAQKAFFIFEKSLSKNKTCQQDFCSFLSLCATGLAFGARQYAHAVRNNEKIRWEKELAAVDQADYNREKYLALIKKLSLNNYGSPEADAVMAKGLIITAAALGTQRDLTEVAQNIITSGDGLIRKKLNAKEIDGKNSPAQIAVIETLSQLGKDATPVLKDFAFNRQTLGSYTYANINLAYFPLAKEEEKQNKENLYNLYCYQQFDLSSQEDFILKQKLAYAYGRGSSLTYVTPARQNKCLVIVPTQPDPMLIAKENTNFVMWQAAFFAATAGIGPVLSSVKNGVRIIKHFKSLRYLAAKKNMTLAQFFKSGQLAKLPNFSSEVAQQTLFPKAVILVKNSTEAQTQTNLVSDIKATVGNSYKEPAFPKPPKLAPAPKPLKLKSAPKKNVFTGEYPSGLKNDEMLAQRWLEYYRNGYFSPRDQIEAIEGMSAAKANNTMEYLYYMSMDEAKQTILEPIRLKGRLPDFMYDSRLVPHTKRLPAGYYKNKFNDNLEDLLALSDTKGILYSHNAELKDILLSMKDYTFKQGFSYQNSSSMSEALRSNFSQLVKEVETKGFKASRAKYSKLWNAPVKGYKNDKEVKLSLKDYFSQTRKSAFKEIDKAVPEFYLNSPKWVSWENERRNLAAVAYTKDLRPNKTLSDKIKNIIRPSKRKYISVENHGKVLTDAHRTVPLYDEAMASAQMGIVDSRPSTLSTKVNNFDVLGGACQSGFGENMCIPGQGYDGTRTVSRFFHETEKNVKVVVFDAQYRPVVVKLDQVSYVVDLMKKDIDLLRASTMASQGIDNTRDLLSVAQVENTLNKLPNLKATIFPFSRLGSATLPADLKGGGLNAHLALFTKRFYPIKTTTSLEFHGIKPVLVKNYWVPKEVSALAGPIHGARLPFLSQVQDRVVEVLSTTVK